MVTSSERILAGDVGGTSTRLALFAAADGGGGEPLRSATYRSREHSSLEPILAEFLGDDAGDVATACLGIAGPVIGNRCRAPNLAWDVDGAALARAAGVPALELVNDLVATAEGLAILDEDDLATLHAGRRRPGAVRLLIGAGTGLGMALLVPRAAAGGDPWDVEVLPSEGGHADFAARTDLEIELLRHLRPRFGRVSVERVVSGPGLARIYAFLRQQRPGEGDPEVARRLAASPGDPLDYAAEEADATPVIAEAALAGRCSLCVAALELLAGALGAVAGSVALTALATGGVYLAGGMPPRLRPALEGGPFLAAFLAKGRFAPLMEEIPVRVVLRPDTALRGAARRAGRRVARAAAESRR